MADLSKYWIETEDWHTAGEPFRIVKDVSLGFLPQSETVLEKYLEVTRSTDHPLDRLRRSLSHEPRGHADMYGGFITPSNDRGAHFGVLFWHTDGFSTACGHGTIALGFWAVANGLVQCSLGDTEVDVTVDVPSGRVTAKVTLDRGKPIHADFVNVLSYQFARGVSVTLPSRGIKVSVDLAFSGAVYASLSAREVDLEVHSDNLHEFIAVGREIKQCLGNRADHGTHHLYGILFHNDQDDASQSGVIEQKSVNIYGNGQVDRSPCGSGTCARLAILLAQSRLKVGETKFLHHSIIGSTFEAEILFVGHSPPGEFPACVSRVRGQSYLVGQMKFWISQEDPLNLGFILR